jgi:hypothetical protein
VESDHKPAANVRLMAQGGSQLQFGLYDMDGEELSLNPDHFDPHPEATAQNDGDDSAHESLEDDSAEDGDVSATDAAHSATVSKLHTPKRRRRMKKSKSGRASTLYGSIVGGIDFGVVEIGKSYSRKFKVKNRMVPEYARN